MNAVVATSAIHHHQRPPLGQDLLAGPLRTKSKKRKSKSDEDGPGYIDSNTSRKILKIGQELQQEDRDATTAKPNSAFTFESRVTDTGDLDEEERYEDDEAWGDEDGEIPEEAEIDPNDLDMFNKFIPAGEEPILDIAKDNTASNQEQGTNLADLILQQIAAHEAAQTTKPDVPENDPTEEEMEIPAKVVEVYTKVGMILSRYKSGKLPKPFKILPTLGRWEELLEITRPDSWTPNACYEATRIFVSANVQVARRFIENVLLPRARDEIHETKHLNVHIFNALKKSCYKPAAFFKGFLLPLVESGTCTLREAQITAGVITRASIPPLHAAAALLRLTEVFAEQTAVSTEGGGATNIFIKTLLEKKYALPYKVIDNLVFHFLRFRAADPTTTNSDHPMSNDAATSSASSTMRNLKLPVLWHQSLLAFAQRYRNDITEDQREALLDLILLRGHKDIGAEVRRELLAGRGRGVVVAEPERDGGDDTMVVDPV